MKLRFLVIGFLLSIASNAQELFALTEPASNMAARSIGFRLDNSIMDEISTSKINYHLIPEIRVGVSKKLMVQGGAFISNRNDRLRVEGGSLYAKYRFLSNDAMQRHFRMAVFGRISFNNSDIHPPGRNQYVRT